MWRNLALVLASFLVSLLVAEAGFRIAGHNFPLTTRYDPETGFTNAGGIDGLADTESVERVTLDQFGLRVRDSSAPQRRMDKPEGVFRIAVMGDSYTEAFHVAYDESFPAVMEAHLNRCPAIRREVEVLNFGVSGYSNIQSLQRFRHKARAFQPDLVLLVVHSANDLHNNFRKHEQNRFIPYGELRDGKLVLDEAFKSDPLFQDKLRWSNLRNDLANHLWSVRFVIATLGRLRQQMWHRERTTHLAAIEPAAATPAVTAVTAVTAVPDVPRPAASAKGWPAPPDPDVAEMAAMFDPASPTPPPYQDPEANPPRTNAEETLWRLAEAAMLELDREVRSAGARLWLTSTATRLAIHPDPALRAAWSERIGYPAPEYTRHRLGAFSAAHGVPYIVLNDALRAHAESTGTNLEYFDKKDVPNGHWNRVGQRIVGETLAGAICDAAGQGW